MAKVRGGCFFVAAEPSDGRGKVIVRNLFSSSGVGGLGIRTAKCIVRDLLAMLSTVVVFIAARGNELKPMPMPNKKKNAPLLLDK